MVQAVRAGRSQQQVARDFGVSPATVNRRVRHARGQRLDRVDWSDRAPIPHTTQRTDAALEDLVLELRRQLRSESDPGFFGAEAILAALQARGVEPLPAARTVYRILRRRGALDGSHRVRRPPPPPGWYVPEVARRRRELDSVDIVEGLVIRGGPQVEVLVPVFVPPREPGFQASIEQYNGSWQVRVWGRFEHADLGGLAGP